MTSTTPDSKIYFFFLPSVNLFFYFCDFRDKKKAFLKHVQKIESVESLTQKYRMSAQRALSKKREVSLTKTMNCSTKIWIELNDVISFERFEKILEVEKLRRSWNIWSESYWSGTSDPGLSKFVVPICFYQ